MKVGCLQRAPVVKVVGDGDNGLVGEDVGAREDTANDGEDGTADSFVLSR